MSLHKIDSELWVPAPLDEVWDFMSDPKNLVELSPKYYGIKVESEGLSRNGAKVVITLSPYELPLKLKWHSSLSDVIESGPQRQFCDIQDQGPFAYWKHLHRFEEGNSHFHGKRSDSDLKFQKAGTWIRDHVDYRLPIGPLGEVAHKFFVKRSLQKMFWYRSQQLHKIFG